MLCYIYRIDKILCNEKLLSVLNGCGVYNSRSESFCESKVLSEDHAALVAVSWAAGGSEWCVRDTRRIIVIACGNGCGGRMVYYSDTYCGVSGKHTDGYRFCEAGQPVFMGGHLKAAATGGAGVVGMGVYEVGCFYSCLIKVHFNSDYNRQIL